MECDEVNYCSGNGTCVEPNYCECNLGYTGIDCSVFSCEALGFCSGNAMMQCDKIKKDYFELSKMNYLRNGNLNPFNLHVV